MTDTDRRKAAQDVRVAQAEMRDFIGRTGRNRQSYREQLHFTDGRGRPGSAGSRPTPRTPVAAIRTDNVTSTLLREAPADRRTPQIVPEGLRIQPHERATGENLARAGYQVRWREIDNTPHAKNPDVLLNDDPNPWEFKAPKGSGASTISNQFRAAKEQGVDRFVFDMARTPLDSETVKAEVRRRFASSAWLAEMLFIGRDGSITRFTRE